MKILKRLKNKIIYFLFLLSIISCKIGKNSIIINEFDNTEYTDIKEKQVSLDGQNDIYWGYTFEDESKIPKGRILTFRGVFEQPFKRIDETYLKFKCLFFNVNDDANVIEKAFEDLKESQCIGDFEGKEQLTGQYDGIFKFPTDKTKKKLIFYLKNGSNSTTLVTLRLRTELKEQIYPTGGSKQFSENLVDVPTDCNLDTLYNNQESISALLLYSGANDLQVYHANNETDAKDYPEKLFGGQILYIFTRPETRWAKYHNASIIVILTGPFGFQKNAISSKKYEYSPYPSGYPISYFMTQNNAGGRNLYNPLSIQIDDCKNPYYLIYNYEHIDIEEVAHFDLIYGKLESIKIAYNIEQMSWIDQTNDTNMEDANITALRYTFPELIKSHLDLYKIKCEVPTLINLYYVNEQKSLGNVTRGAIIIRTLKPGESLKIRINDVYNEFYQFSLTLYDYAVSPKIGLAIGENGSETILDQNQLFPATALFNPQLVTITEHGDSNTTRIIFRISYNYDPKWPNVGNSEVKYAEEFKIYAYKFDELPTRKYNIKSVTIKVYGRTNDNIKFCYSTNLLFPLTPNSENCFRVSNTFPYSLTFKNPSLMYNSQYGGVDYSYFVTFKTKEENYYLNFTVTENEYENMERVYEGESKSISINLATSSGDGILTVSKKNKEKILLQAISCDSLNDFSYQKYNIYTNETIGDKKDVTKDTFKYYEIYDDPYIDTKITINGYPKQNVYISYTGIDSDFTPDFMDFFLISFNEETNQLYINNPLNNPNEEFKYFIVIRKQDMLDTTICDFFELEKDKEAVKGDVLTVTSSQKSLNYQILFSTLDNYKEGDTFYLKVYAKGTDNGHGNLGFLSDQVTGKVGSIKEGSVVLISQKMTIDKVANYTYIERTVGQKETIHYFKFDLRTIPDIPESKIGALRAIINDEVTSNIKISNITCVVINNEKTDEEMIYKVDILEEDQETCYGNKIGETGGFDALFAIPSINNTGLNTLVIKVVLENPSLGDKYSIYIEDSNREIKVAENAQYDSDYADQKTLMPYHIDLNKIDDETDISKIIFFSRSNDLQVLYANRLSQTTQSYKPISLFSGNILLAYTQRNLTRVKYNFPDRLVVIRRNLNSENVNEKSTLGDKFVIDVTMLKSDSSMNYYVSSSKTGRNLDSPIKEEISECVAGTKNYLFYNYNIKEDKKKLYTTYQFGRAKSIKMATSITGTTWEEFKQFDFKEIDIFEEVIQSNNSYIDVFEIECESPLGIEIYYREYTQDYHSSFKEGDTVIAVLDKDKSGANTLTIKLSLEDDRLYYALSTFTKSGLHDVRYGFSNNTMKIVQNSLIYGEQLNYKPTNVYINNYGNDTVRIIFKIGHSLNNSDLGWRSFELEKGAILFLNEKKNIYALKFPIEDEKYSFEKLEFYLKFNNTGTEFIDNYKYCISGSYGVISNPSGESCHRSGLYTRYAQTGLNPFSYSKQYNLQTDNYYLIFKCETAYCTITNITGLKYIEYDTKYRIEENKNGLIVIDETKKGMAMIGYLTLTNDQEKSGVELVKCNKNTEEIKYEFSKAHNLEIIDSGTLNNNDIKINKEGNNYAETYLTVTGEPNEKVFIKNFRTSIITQFNINSSLSYDSGESTLIIGSPIKGSLFTYYIISDTKERLESLTLCDFVGKSEEEILNNFTFVEKTNNRGHDSFSWFIDTTLVALDQTTKKFNILIYAIQGDEYGGVEYLYPVNEFIAEGYKVQLTQILDVDENIASVNFYKNKTHNYFFYDFRDKEIDGSISTLRVGDGEGAVSSKGVNIGTLACVWIGNEVTEDYLTENIVIETQNAVKNSTKNMCDGKTNSDTYEYNSIFKVNTDKNKRILGIVILYALNNDTDDDIKYNYKISLCRTAGKIGEEGLQEYVETNTFIPILVDLLKIRNEEKTKEGNKVSQVMFYHYVGELQAYYTIDDNPKPIRLFTGNVLLLYTNPNMIREKYQNASKFVLFTQDFNEPYPTDLSVSSFYTYYFDTNYPIKYYQSSEEDGRLLFAPLSIQVDSCDRPYYYILNYNKEDTSEKVIHIDQVYGKVDVLKMNIKNEGENKYPFTWDKLKEYLKNISNFQTTLEMSKEEGTALKFLKHIDVIEITCKVPTLLNVYYTDPIKSLKKINIGDVAIINLKSGESKEFRINLAEGASFADIQISLTTYRDDGLSPYIKVTSFQKKKEIKKNGVTSCKIDSDLIKIENLSFGAGGITRVIVKIGRVIESYDKINDVYYFQLNGENNYAYKFRDTNLDFLKSVTINITTDYDGNKFCVDSNIGAFLDPTLQNCYRVARDTPYKLTFYNPIIMFKDYEFERMIPYYIGFKPVNKEHTLNFTILKAYYDSNIRNDEYFSNQIIKESIGNISTILGNPTLGSEYVFIQIASCTKNENVDYSFRVAFDQKDLNFTGTVNNSVQYIYQNIPNPLMEIELVLNTNLNNKIFVKHSGTTEKYEPIILDFKVEYNELEFSLKFNKPVAEKLTSFRYTDTFTYILIAANYEELKKKGLTLCDCADQNATPLSFLSEVIVEESNANDITFLLDELKNEDIKTLIKSGNFDIHIYAYGNNLGHVSALSEILQHNEVVPPQSSEEQSSEEQSSEEQSSEEKSSEEKSSEEQSSEEQSSEEKSSEEKSSEEKSSEEQSSEEKSSEEPPVQSSEEKQEGLTTTVIIIIGCCCGVFVIGLIILIIYLIRRKKNSQQNGAGTLIQGTATSLAEIND